MNIEFENDLENSRMIMKISWKRRKKISQSRVVMKTHEILEYARKNYEPPSDYTLGDCVEGLKTADNDSTRRQSIDCVFRLDKKTPVVKKKVTKKASPKKTTRKK
tara:strand:+ start:502 stop:816 length:315 start_codon:yes stop_codon:yes gene_type:complete